DRHLLERAGIERVGARELGPGVERHLVSVAVGDARATKRNATSAEGEFPAGRARARRSARGIVLVALPAKLRALGFEHRGDGLHTELVDEGEEATPDERREWDEQLGPQRRLVLSRFLGRLLHGGSFRVKHPEVPSGPGGTATLKFHQSAGR